MWHYIFFPSILLYIYILNKRRETRVPKRWLRVRKGLACGAVEQQNGIRSLPAQRSGMKSRCCSFPQASPPSVSATPSVPVTLLNQLVGIRLRWFCVSDLDHLSRSNSVVCSLTAPSRKAAGRPLRGNGRAFMGPETGGTGPKEAGLRKHITNSSLGRGRNCSKAECVLLVSKSIPTTCLQFSWAVLWN